jgi:hypothetical protein
MGIKNLRNYVRALYQAKASSCGSSSFYKDVIPCLMYAQEFQSGTDSINRIYFETTDCSTVTDCPTAPKILEFGRLPNDDSSFTLLQDKPSFSQSSN